ncbi:MAG: biotin--[acetyl-CoA-carboxylase] ligase [Elusimicrobia bacterium]|nr:biotin--[acetyl-CoA-carboxylase] ligase [Elusimicrobiota bacterium]
MKKTPAKKNMADDRALSRGSAASKAVEAAAAPPPGVARLVRKKVIASTQTLARELADKGAPAWTVVWADRQSRGRGRMERRWASGPGGLYASIILRPHIRPTHLARLSLEAGKAAAEAVAEASGLETRIEMPNDVLARARGGEYRKVCGILIEAAGDSRHIDWVVVGVGVNVNNKVPKSLPQASSLAFMTGKEHSVEAVLAAVIDRFHAVWG